MGEIGVLRRRRRQGPAGKFPEVRWIELQGSKLWVSYGEINALADYLPDPSAIDSLPRSTVLPVLQRMRAAASAYARDNIEVSEADALGQRGGEDEEELAADRGRPPRLAMKGAAWAGAKETLPEAVAETLALGAATAGLGANRYEGLLARNACHFAPFSWQRWALFHNEARDNAEKYYVSQTERKPIKNVDASSNEYLRQAFLNNGYGDHFLQDSFASGHLVNKTLVMQWFIDYLNNLPSAWWFDPFFLDTEPAYGLPDDEVMANMGTAQQPGIGGRGLYGTPPTTGTSASEDRTRGRRQIDPQSAEERRSAKGRQGGSGATSIEIGTPGRPAPRARCMRSTCGCSTAPPSTWRGTTPTTTSTS